MNIAQKKNIFFIFVAALLSACGGNGGSSFSSDLPIRQTDDCTHPYVQIAIMDDIIHRSFPIFLKASLGVYYYASYDASERGNINSFAINNLMPITSTAAVGYDQVRHFSLDSLVTNRANPDTGASECIFTVRALGNKTVKRDINFTIGNDEISARRVRFAFPDEDVVLHGVLVINKSLLSSVESGSREDSNSENCHDDWQGGLERRCIDNRSYGGIEYRIQWKEVTFGSVGSIQIGPYVGTGENATVRKAALYVWCSPVSWAWSEKYVLEGYSVGDQTPYSRNDFPYNCTDGSHGESVKDSGWVKEGPSSWGPFLWVGPPPINDRFRRLGG